MSNMNLTIHDVKELNVTRKNYGGTYWLEVVVVDADGERVEMNLIYDVLHPLRVKVIEEEKEKA